LKIESIEAVAVEIPLRKNFGGSTYTVLKRCTVATRLRTDEGLAAEVYNGDNRSHGREIVRLIHEDLAPRVKGLDILEVERAWQAMFDLSHTSADRKLLLERNRVQGIRPLAEHERLAEGFPGADQAQHLLLAAVAAQRELDHAVGDAEKAGQHLVPAADHAAAPHVLHARMPRELGQMRPRDLPEQLRAIWKKLP